MIKKNRIICCGNIAFDLTKTVYASRNAARFTAYPGGSVFNTALILSRLGLDVHMLSKTGKDFLGDALLEVMRQENISTKLVSQSPDIKTGLAFAKLDKKGDSSYSFYKPDGRHTAFSNTDLPASLFNNVSVFHTGSAYAYADYTFQSTLRLMRLAQNNNVFVSFDPNWRGAHIKDKKKMRERIRRLLPYVDLLKLSKEDALGITGAKTLTTALKQIDHPAVITRGAKGSFFWNGETRKYQSAFKINVTDTIGAGDAFTAGLIYRYCVDNKTTGLQKEDLRFATAISSLVCQKSGSSDGVQSLTQVNRFLKRQA